MTAITPVKQWELEVDYMVREILSRLKAVAKEDHSAQSLHMALSMVMCLFFDEQFDRLDEISASEMTRFVSQSTDQGPDYQRLRRILLQ